MNHQLPLVTHQAADFLAGGGEMAELIRSKDWSATPLGPIEDWPQSLRTTVSLCLASSFPINIIWGADHTQIYNDGYRVVCGEGHPVFLGRNYAQSWASAWSVIGGPFERALAGQTSFLVNQRMFLHRNGYLEETFLTFSTSPIRDETGGIGGLFHPVTETTATMLAQRRIQTIRDFTAHLGEARTTDQVFRFAIETIGEFKFDLPFALIYAAAADGAGYRLVEHTGLEPGSATSPLSLSLEDATPWPVAELIRSGARAEVSGLRELFGTTQYGPLREAAGHGPLREAAGCGPYEEPPDTAFALPILSPGSDIPIAIMIAGASSRLPLDDAYQGFYDLIAAAFTAGLAKVRAFEAECRRAAEIALARGLAALRETEDDLAFALKAGRLGSWKFDLTTRRLTASEICRANFGAGPAVRFNSYRDILSRIEPADRKHLRGAVRHAVGTGSDFDVECRAMHANGDTAWIMIRGRASYDGNRVPLLATGVSLDITERKQAEERQKLLLDELNHRVKNTLATVQSIAMQTRYTADSPATYAETLTARIEALSEAHDLLTRASWEGAELADVVRQTLTPYAFGSGGHPRMAIAGPPVRLGPNAAITLNMAFHELATNAARYGSLSIEDGYVNVRWRIDRSTNPPVIEIVWTETGGPPAQPPSRRGFGSRLIEQGLARELGGEVRLDFSQSGVRCRMILPASGKIEPV